jgi:hypothetical protein
LFIIVADADSDADSDKGILQCLSAMMDWIAGEERLGTHSNRNKLSLQANGIMV